MQANRVVYQIRCGRDGLPRVVRVQAQKRPGTEAPSLILLILGSHPQGGKQYLFLIYTISRYW
jgi:hypothetical protein